MVVIPIYNLLIVPDANIYLKEDQYRHPGVTAKELER
jgi:hypothetical protein